MNLMTFSSSWSVFKHKTCIIGLLIVINESTLTQRKTEQTSMLTKDFTKKLIIESFSLTSLQDNFVRHDRLYS